MYTENEELAALGALAGAGVCTTCKQVALNPGDFKYQDVRLICKCGNVYCLTCYGYHVFACTTKLKKSEL